MITAGVPETASSTTADNAAFDDRFFLVLGHDSGVSSRVSGHWALQGEVGHRFRVHCEADTLVVPEDDGQTAPVLAGRTPATEGRAWGRVPPSRWGSVWRDGAATPVPSRAGSWSSFYSELARAVRGDGPVPVDPWDSVAGLEVIDASRRSARTGQVVAPARAVTERAVTERA